MKYNDKYNQYTIKQWQGAKCTFDRLLCHCFDFERRDFMKEISLHILDIVQNSIAAEADLVEIMVKENFKEDTLTLIIKDNGRGMDHKEQEKVLDPFVTSRKTREVGLGLPFLKKAAQNCDGELKLDSTPGEGTEVMTIFKHSHIDRAPLGNMTGTITTLITTNPSVDFIYSHIVKDNNDHNKFELNTKDIRKEIADIAINNPQVVDWIESYLKENLTKLRNNT